jgi:hypothetical protein
MWVMQESLSLVENKRMGADLDCVINWMIICILMRTQTILTREALMNLMGKTTFLLHQISLNWRIKFSKWYGLSGGYDTVIKKVVLQMKIIIVAKGYFVQILILIMNKSVTFGFQLRIYWILNGTKLNLPLNHD